MTRLLRPFCAYVCGALSRSGSIRLSIRCCDSLLCRSSGSRMKLPVMLVMLRGKVVFASIPMMVVCVLLSLPIQLCMLAHASG